LPSRSVSRLTERQFAQHAPAALIFEYLSGLSQEGEGFYLLWTLEILAKNVRLVLIVSFILYACTDCSSYVSCVSCVSCVVFWRR